MTHALGAFALAHLVGAVSRAPRPPRRGRLAGLRAILLRTREEGMAKADGSTTFSIRKSKDRSGWAIKVNGRPITDLQEEIRILQEHHARRYWPNKGYAAGVDTSMADHGYDTLAKALRERGVEPNPPPADYVPETK